MERLVISDVEPDPLGAGSYRRRLSEALDTAALAINVYNVAPGDGLPGGLHAHVDQGEVFVVLEGEATFETLDGASRSAANSPCWRSAPRGTVGTHGSPSRVRSAATGARDCPECGHDDLHVTLADGPGETVIACPRCNAEFDTAPLRD